MISSVRGSVAEVGLDSAVIEVGGVGLHVQCAPATLASLRVGEPARLATSLVVREDSLTLYGFASDDERQVFQVLLSASGVGPKIALAMLAVHTPESLREAIFGENLVALTSVPGIGRKGAQRVVLELKDRIGPPRGDSAGWGGAGPAAEPTGWRDQVLSALVGLGWSVREAEGAVDAVAHGAGDQADVPTLLRAALRTLSKA
jgi:Holliday junction DNA helicase RuvA